MANISLYRSRNPLELARIGFCNNRLARRRLRAFRPEEARRLVERFEWHYTPKHGSWLNMAESELAVLSGQCLDRRISCLAGLQNEVTAWLEQRNAHHAKANWRFTTADARIKLKSLYPAF